MTCRAAPAGWSCSRAAGHSGPCAASQTFGYTEEHRQSQIAAGKMLEIATAEMMASFGQAASPIADASAGYKARLLDGGFAEATAETMTIAFHQFLMTAFERSIFDNPGGPL